MVLRCSGAEIWANCPGSTTLSKVEQPATEESREGDLCHLLTALMIQGEISSKVTVKEVNGRFALTGGNPSGLLVTESHLGMAVEACAYALSLCDSMPRVEFPVKFGPVEGTCDFIGYHKPTKTLHILDFKFGHGSVEAFKNKQLLCYAEGARDLKGFPVDKLVLHIYQPRDYVNGPIKTWELSPAEWAEGSKDLIWRAEKAVLGTPCATGSHCRYCPSRVHCKPFRALASRALESVEENPEDCPLESLGAEYANLLKVEKLVKAARVAFEDHITSKIEGGAPVAGWMLGRSAGRRAWTATVEEIQAVEAMTGCKLTEVKPVTITEAWRNVAARPMLESLVEKSEGSKKLVPFKVEVFK